MKSKLLLSHKFKWLGAGLFIPAFILGYANLFYEFEFSFLAAELKPWQMLFSEEGILNSIDNNYTDELALTACVAGLMLLAFSREKKEDEFIQRVRLESFQWSVMVSYIMLILCTWLIYGSSFFIAMVINLITVLVIYNLRFHWVLMKSSKTTEQP